MLDINELGLDWAPAEAAVSNCIEGRAELRRGMRRGMRWRLEEDWMMIGRRLGKKDFGMRILLITFVA